MKPVYIKWIDSEVPVEPWHDLTDVTTCLKLAESIGWVVGEDDNFLVLALSIDRENNYGGPLKYIPKVAIKDMVQIEVKYD